MRWYTSLYMDTASSFVTNITHTLSLATIIGLALLVLWIVFLTVHAYSKKGASIVTFLSQYVLPLGFLISASGVIFSLVYSEVFGFIPCDLCWYQRILLYPQALLFAYAWWKKDRNVLGYSLILSVIGLVISGYHHALQVGYDMYKPCSASPFAIDCAKPSFVEFGFVTFPLMAFVLFGFLIALIVTARRVFTIEGK